MFIFISRFLILENSIGLLDHLVDCLFKFPLISSIDLLLIDLRLRILYNCKFAATYILSLPSLVSVKFLIIKNPDITSITRITDTIFITFFTSFTSIHYKNSTIKITTFIFIFFPLRILIYLKSFNINF
ncbi:hypothetical protein H04402_02197 [Clostridium botulinum H04402 065]|nr:hypothetical protein H04402_02197 [Clostridium botulinum H04402 065]